MKMNERFLAEVRRGEWEELDLNKDGTISIKDIEMKFKQDPRCEGEDLDPKEGAGMMKWYGEEYGDKDGSGTISFDEFASHKFKKKKRMEPRQYWQCRIRTRI